MKKFFYLTYIFFTFFLTGCINSCWDNDFSYTNIPPFYTVALRHNVEKEVKEFHPTKQNIKTWKELEPSLKASLLYVSKKNPDQVAVVHGTVAITWGEILNTVESLLDILPLLDDNPQLLAEKFYWVGLTEGAKFIGYYQPQIKASYTQTKEYTYPLYQVPSDMQTLYLGTFDKTLVGKKIVYRQTENGLKPYYTRKDIDEKKVLQGRGLEIAWLASKLDGYFLHTQGTGLLEFPDGTLKHACFVANNGLPYHNLMGYLDGHGFLLGKEKSKEGIRAWALQNPMDVEKILYLNNRYVFFSFFQDGPIGSMGSVLTPFISVCVDPAVFPLGSVLAFDCPESTGAIRQGLCVAQDSGDVVGRKVDIFCGSGKYAESQSLSLKGQGNVWLLLSR